MRIADAHFENLLILFLRFLVAQYDVTRRQQSIAVFFFLFIEINQLVNKQRA